MPGWKLHPSALPEQGRYPFQGGRIRYVGDLDAEAVFPDHAVVEDDGWQALVEGRAPLIVPPHAQVTVLWDLEQYHTAYPVVATAGGQGATLCMEWAEACYVPENEARRGHVKGHRDVIAGKYFRGYGDTFLPDGQRRTFRPFWWRAGRYVRIRVTTRDSPLTLEKMGILETRMPLENAGAFRCDDPDFERIVALAVRGIQMCAHETYLDCPYYEQLMYVGDTRLQMLTAYVMSREDRLNQRALMLFDWSRRETGFVLERYPSDPKQLSATFAMIWLLMLRDYAWWRNEPEFVRARLKGLRCLLEEFKAHQGNARLLPPLPGWSFIDWENSLRSVNPPTSPGGPAAVVNLLLILALQAAAEIETALGESHLAAYNRAWARRLAAAVDEVFWNAGRGLFAEDPGHTRFSEHSQCLALLSGCFPDRAARCFEALITAEDLLQTTVYFSFYLLEVFQRFGRGDLLVEKLDFWKQMANRGLKTPVEKPEPSRSDCHAWGSHPLFHMHASLAGIRPAQPGFQSVRIAPSPGPLRTIHSVIPHPQGTLRVSLRAVDEAWRVQVSLPEGVPGVLEWKGTSYPLSGSQAITLPT